MKAGAGEAVGQEYFDKRRKANGTPETKQPRIVPSQTGV